MTHFALICPPFPSHVRLFEALGEALAARGHRSTFVLNEGARPLVRSGACAVRTASGTSSGADLGSLVERMSRGGPAAVLRTVAVGAELTDALCRDAPALLRELGAEAVIADQMEPAGGLVAEHLGLPFVSVASALPIERDPAVPLPFLSWPYDASDRGLRRNRAGERVAALLMTRQRRTIVRWSRRLGLAPRRDVHECLSGRLSVSQTVVGFDFPRRADTASRLRHVGPIRGTENGNRALTCEIDAARPFVFASLGTLLGHRLEIFHAVADACRELDAQLLVAHCAHLTRAQAESIGATWVTDFAPQREVLKRADVCVTHAGLNTVLDALEHAVPLLAIPLAFDQPGVAARLVHHGLGVRLSAWRFSAGRVREALRTLLVDSGYRRRARAVGEEIRRAGGANAAAALIEASLGEVLCNASH